MKLDVFPTDAFPLHVHAAVEQHLGDGWVGDETERFFRGRRLTDVTLDSLSNEYKGVWWAAHNFLNDEAYLFFLPAFMNVALDNYETSEGARMLADALANSFLRMARGEQDHRLLPMLRGYSQEQLGQVAQFLLELSRDRFLPVNDLDDARPALELFWSRYIGSD